MKTRLFSAVAVTVGFLTLIGCEPGIQKSNIPDETPPVLYNYSVSVSQVQQSNAPALQSFAHGVDGDNVLLFGGRTNNTTDAGGLHNMDDSSNYANSSFRPLSYNNHMIVYNMESGTADSLTKKTLEEKLVAQYCKGAISECQAFFKRAVNNLCNVTNPISTQAGNQLYVLGGYGFGPTLADSTTYHTYNQVTTIDVPTMIKLVKGDSLTDSAWDKLIRIGIDPTNTLISTGAEMFKIGDSIYLAGGHKYDSSQQYLYAVYPFAVTNDPNSDYFSIVTAGKAISNLADPKTISNDNNSTFRRRDGPVTAALFKNSAGTLTEGFNFYGGVFQAGSAHDVWNTAINIHPSISKGYTIDDSYNQKFQSIYACSDFSTYDSNTETLHTFLLGGIGNDTAFINPNYLGPNSDTAEWLKGFTNNGLHIEMDVNSKVSTPEVLVDVFPSDTTKMYGAESTLIPTTSADVQYISVANDITEVIDLENSVFTNDKLVVGHVYGGIEAFQLNPGAHGTGNGPGLSGASNKIWEVTLIRTEQ